MFSSAACDIPHANLTGERETREDGRVFTLPMVAVATPLSSYVSSADLAISLVFGAGQVAVGGALVWRGLRRGRWRRVAPFTMALIGLWLMCSGIAELIVSGLEATARGWHAPAPQTVSVVRQTADTGLLGAAVLLAGALALYLVWWRVGGVRRSGRDV